MIASASSFVSGVTSISGMFACMRRTRSSQPGAVCAVVEGSSWQMEHFWITSSLPNEANYGRLSVMSQWLCHVRQDFNVAKEAFTPPPKVTSTVVTLTPRAEPLAEATWESLEKVTAAAFNQRRKMLRASLKAFNFDFEALGLKETARAEELSVEDFCKLARQI